MMTASTTGQYGPTSPSSSSSSSLTSHRDHGYSRMGYDGIESTGSNVGKSDSDLDMTADKVEYEGSQGSQAGIPLQEVTTFTITTRDENKDVDVESLVSCSGDGRRWLDAQRPPVRNRKYAKAEEDSVVQKFDRNLVSFLAALYLVSFLDRSNIGNARIAGMDEDLQTHPPQQGWYEWALTAFYLTYIGFEWMSILWRIIPAHLYVFAIVMTWGLAASLQSVATSYPQLIFLRAVLGVGEAAFTGVPFYLSFFFRREELAYRTAIFISAAPLATSIASSVAWLILRVAGGEDGGRGDGAGVAITPWRLLFLVEGLPSVVMAVVAWHKIPDKPETASFLTPRERRVAKWRLRDEEDEMAAPRYSSSSGQISSREKTRHKKKRFFTDIYSGAAVLRNPGPWLTAAMLFLANMAYSSLPVFLPTILTDMGYGPLAAQAMAAPPYLLSFVWVLIVSRLSDTSRSRSPYLILCASISACGYLTLSASEPLALPLAVRYAAVYPAAAGFFGAVTLTVAWNVNNGRGAAERGFGFVLLQMIGQCGPLFGTRLYPRDEGPYYTRGMTVCGGAMVGVAVLAWILRFWLVRVNGALDLEEGADSEEGQELVPSVGDGGVGGRKGRKRRKNRREGRFRYML